jgi:hypothetical protein
MRLTAGSLLPALVICIGLAPGVSAGPISELYLSDSSSVFVVQGNSVVRSWTKQTTGDHAIAVDGSVKTIGYTSGAQGHEYTLAGVQTGLTATNTLGYAFLDGTTDGSHIYSPHYNNGGEIYRFDNDWSNPQLMFSTGLSAELSITFDPTDDTLWVKQWSNTSVFHYSMTGTLLGSFVTNHALNTALALDHADNTLWMYQRNDGILSQYDKGGTLLETVDIAALGNRNFHGGEFDFASLPEPSTALLMGLGLVGLAASRRRRVS